MTLSDRLPPVLARRGVRNGLGIAAAAIVVLVWWWWPLTRAHSSVDVVVVGDGAVAQSRDELARRLRQEGMVPSVVEIEATDCDDLRAALGDIGDALVVLSLDNWSACGDLAGVDLLVQQPGGLLPSGLEATLGVRAAAPLFGADAQPCEWWDTPGAGEDRPGLGKCGTDGRVVVVDDGGLTPAGRERFARLVVEAVK